MTYSPKAIQLAKTMYADFLRYESRADYAGSSMTPGQIEEAILNHNKTVDAINTGDKALEREWKLFFCNEAQKQVQKEEDRKAKLAANKAASADVLAPIKAMRQLGAFGQWLNTSGNPYRKQHFTKKYTQEAVDAYMAVC